MNKLDPQVQLGATCIRWSHLSETELYVMRTKPLVFLVYDVRPQWEVTGDKFEQAK